MQVKDLRRRENIALGQIVLHSDNGSRMKGSTILATMITLGVMASLNCRSVSNDNPYSESLLTTLKYRSAHPVHPFVDITAARNGVNTHVQWHIQEHRHSATRFLTLEQRHGGLDAAILQQRSALYESANQSQNLLRNRLLQQNDLCDN